jgi:hypothetical protein
MLIKRRTVMVGVLACVLSSAGFVIGRGFSGSRHEGRPTRQSSTRPTTGPALPDGPAEWVPVIADVRTTDHGGEVREKFYRSRDGSTRIDAYAPATNARRTTIHNLPARATFYQSPAGLWSTIRLMSGIPTSPRTRLFLTKTEAAAAPTPERLEQFTVFRLPRGEGAQAWLAPELNYLELKSASSGGDRVREFYNIQLVEPDPTLFSPPPNAQVREALTINDLFADK